MKFNQKLTFQTCNETVVNAQGITIGAPNISIELTIPQEMTNVEAFRTDVQSLF